MKQFATTILDETYTIKTRTLSNYINIDWELLLIDSIASIANKTSWCVSENERLDGFDNICE